MYTTSIVVAYDKNKVIGNEGKLPDWKLPSDMNHFKILTTGYVVIMGRKTYESIPRKFRPLPDRDNIVVTRNKAWAKEQVSDREQANGNLYIVHSLIDAQIQALQLGHKKIFVIGGAEIYNEALNKIPIHEIIATEIVGKFNGNIYFPILDLDNRNWEKTILQPMGRSEYDTHDFEIVKYAINRD